MNDLVLGRNCDASSIQRALRPGANGQPVTVDLRSVNWFTPFGIVAVCAFVERQRSRGRDVTFLGPSDPSRANYLARMRLDQRLEEMGVAHGLRGVREHANAGLLELRAFSSDDEVEEFAIRIYDLVSPQSPSAAKALHRFLSEAGQNVAPHSGGVNGFMAAQQVGRNLRFAVGDGGKGFFNNLESFGATSDREALSLALVDGVSSTGKSGRGRGIRSTARVVQEANGHMIIASGHASITQTVQRTSHMSFARKFRGAVIEGVVPI